MVYFTNINILHNFHLPISLIPIHLSTYHSEAQNSALKVGLLLTELSL